MNLERGRWHRVSDRMQLPENYKASGDHALHMRSHHKVGNDEDTQVTNGLNWVIGVPLTSSVDLGSCYVLQLTKQVRHWQIVSNLNDS